MGHRSGARAAATGLLAPSLAAPSLAAPSLVAPSLVAPSLVAPSLVAPISTYGNVRGSAPPPSRAAQFERRFKGDLQRHHRQYIEAPSRSQVRAARRHALPPCPGGRTRAPPGALPLPPGPVLTARVSDRQLRQLSRAVGGGGRPSDHRSPYHAARSKW